MYSNGINFVLQYVCVFFSAVYLIFLQVQNWVRELRRMLGNDICLVIAGNKVDLEKERNVSQEKAEA